MWLVWMGSRGASCVWAVMAVRGDGHGDGVLAEVLGHELRQAAIIVDQERSRAHGHEAAYRTRGRDAGRKGKRL
jgi:hypothetical protein